LNSFQIEILWHGTGFNQGTKSLDEPEVISPMFNDY